jgi:hypothetical protein
LEGRVSVRAHWNEIDAREGPITIPPPPFGPVAELARAAASKAEPERGEGSNPSGAT